MSASASLFGFGLTQVGMLWWLAAAAAPLLIHLLSRRRYREVPWAAVEYLLAAMQKSSRRLRAEQLILLVIRTLTIVCVVVAIAGPYLEQLGGTLVTGQPVHRILVIDGSYSMGYKPGEKRRFELAKQVARDIVGRSSSGDGFSLVLMS
ncbi:MAG TPA: BatA domain-containing protein, partial [Pirellulales bacterium]|nr:BatA domain-containing protein [Pirellulales bacterium]